MASCSKCGAILEEHASTCPACGEPIATKIDEPLHDQSPVKSELLSIAKLLGVVAVIFVVGIVVLANMGLVGMYVIGTMISGTPVEKWMQRESECLPDEARRLEVYLISGSPCLAYIEHPRSRELRIPVITWAIANSRHLKSNECLVEYTITNGSPIALKTLLENGADPGECPGSIDALYSRALRRTWSQPSIHFFQVLHDSNHRPTDPKKFLFEAAAQGNAIAVNYAIERLDLRKSINAPNEQGQTALDYAVVVKPTAGNWSAIRELLKSGADPTRVGPDGESTLAKAKRLYSGNRNQFMYEKEFEYWLRGPGK